MPIEIRTIWITVNRLLTIINGFLLGILGGLTPFHSKNGLVKKIPLAANIILLLTLAFILFAEIRVHYF